jgi:CDP-6-deoxy-D-xylo-4-hexulose-3-dehydrase
LPEKAANSEPSWFGFALTIRESSKFNRQDILNHLAENKIGTRLLFAGDLTKQPSFKAANFKKIGNLNNTRTVTENTFWLGCWPGLKNQHLDYIYESVLKFIKK